MDSGGSNTKIHLKAWVSAFNNAIIRAYKKIGHCRISNIKNEICIMEQTYVIKSDADVDAYNAQIDIFMNQIERITACINVDMDIDDQNNSNDEHGTCALFHGHDAILNDGMVKILTRANYSEDLYYDYYDDYDDENSNNLKINVKKQGFDVIYDYMLHNQLFSTSETRYIKNELQVMRATIIMEMCKNDSHQIKEDSYA